MLSVVRRDEGRLSTFINVRRDVSHRCQRLPRRDHRRASQCSSGPRGTHVTSGSRPKVTSNERGANSDRVNRTPTYHVVNTSGRRGQRVAHNLQHRSHPLRHREAYHSGRRTNSGTGYHRRCARPITRGLHLVRDVTTGRVASGGTTHVTGTGARASRRVLSSVHGKVNHRHVHAGVARGRNMRNRATTPGRLVTGRKRAVLPGVLLRHRVQVRRRQRPRA